MQTPIHFFTGIFISKLISFFLPSITLVFQIGIIIILSYFSHYLIDCIAIMTYHPYEANWNDKFFKIYHIFIYITSLVLAILFFKQFWWVMIASILPDIVDWYILRGIFKKKPIIHPQIDKLREKLFSCLPDWKEKKTAALIEWALFGIIGLGIILL